ncbi:MAG: glycosyltransferase family 4 protein [Planctomycetota bacterium]|nr:glycosyltransferase family 4 protein [Planctomycetota bacterium]
MVTQSKRSLATLAWKLTRSSGGQSARIDSAHSLPTPKLDSFDQTSDSASKPKRILFVNQYYWPDHASTAQHLADLAESLAAEGHECHVLCGLGQYRTGSAQLPSHEVQNGVHIHRVRVSAFGRKSTLHRMCDYLSYYAQATRKALFMKRFDLVITLTTPPLIGLVGSLLKSLKGSRQIFWSMDLHPDASLALGRMQPSNLAVRLLKRISHSIYRRADRVVVLGPYMADQILAKGVRPERVREVPVWSRRDEIFPRDRSGHPLREELGLTDQFVVMYSGNLGLAHQFEEIIEAAQKLQERSDITFLFVGDGPRLKEVKAAVASKSLTNVRFMDYFPRNSLHLSLSAADVHLITMRDCMTGIVVPGKLYGAMASGRPSIFVGPRFCESADTIRESECGQTIASGDSANLTKAIRALADQPELAAELGKNARRAFLRSFESRNCCARWAEIVAELLGLPSRVNQPVPTSPITLEPAIAALDAA